jgi:hypothetical protein
LEKPARLSGFVSRESVRPRPKRQRRFRMDEADHIIAEYDAASRKAL